jgi:uncharacterized repeat protein (TIGR01451 family)
VIHLRSGVIVALVTLFVCLDLHAAGTPAGTDIENTAQISYTIGSTTLSAASNTTTIRVAEIVDVTVTVNPAPVSVAPGATEQPLIFTVTNTGNGSEAFLLSALSTLPSDDFDPVLSAPNSIYIDSDNDGLRSAGDTPYGTSADAPVLAADASVRVFVLNGIPAGATDGQRGRSQLVASASTGTGAPGTSFTVAGVEAIIGTTGGDGDAAGEYRVEALQVSAIKSQSIVDAFGGGRPIPGARINYQIIVTATGTGTASAVNFSDPIPANTTYVPGSLTLNSAVLSDSTANDAGEYATSPTPRVLVTLGNLTQASGPQTITFAVTIN